MALVYVPTRTYHVFVASPGDVSAERQAVRDYFADYNRSIAEPRGFRFEVLDWENYSVAGAGRPQELITRQVLERYRSSLALVIGILAQRFGSPSGTHESGTEEEFEWALANVRSGFPELTWFFRDVLELKLDPGNPAEGLAQWQRVQAFRARVEAEKKVFVRPYPSSEQFRAALDKNLDLWLSAAERPWFAEKVIVAVPAEWPAETLAALAQRLNDEFVQHMSGGEAIAAADARARYVQSIVRPRRAARPTQNEEHADPAPDEGPLDDFITADGAQLLIVGAGGTGKTTLLRQLAASGAQRAVENPSAPVFLYLRLSSFDRSEGAFDALMNLLSLASRTPRTDFEQWWRSGSRPMTILLDGVNEVAAAYRSGCTQALWTLLQNSSPRHRYVITSRPGGELESMAVNSVDNRQLRVADILEFTWLQVEAFLAAQGRSDLRSRLSGELAGLASNPFLLWAIVRTSGDSPHIRNRGTLFQALIGDYIFEKRERRKPAPRPTNYSYRLVKEPVLSRLALTMIEQGMTDLVDGPVLYQEIAAQLIALEQSNRRALALQAETFMPQNYSGEGLVREVIENGVLIREGDRLRFMHESVQEYFAAVACRDEPADALVERVRPLNLARLESRGPTFEMLVTWAGLATPTAVGRLVEAVRQKHVLLAVHLAREAALGEEYLQPLRDQLILLAGSDHEQRRMLSVLGLAVIPSADFRVVGSLLGLLRESHLSSKVLETLKATATPETLSLAIGSWLSTEEDLTDNRVNLIHDVAADDPRAVAEAFLIRWQNPEMPRERLTLLARSLGQRGRSFESPTRILDTLATMASEAELAGNAARTAVLDELRVAIQVAPAPPPGGRMVNFVERLDQSMTELVAWLDERKQFKALLAGMTDAEVGALLTSEGDDRRRGVVLETLVARGAPAAVAPVVSASLADQCSRWILDLQVLPRELVRSRLGELSATLDGEPLRRAQQLAELVSESPSPTILTNIFAEGSVQLRTAAATAAARSGTAGVELLQEQAARENDVGVLEAILRALGASHHPLAGRWLLDLLFDRGARQHWPSHPGDLAPFVGGWAFVIHDALSALRQEAAVLDRVEELIRAPNPGRNEELVHEARRWLPSSRARSILEEAVTHADAETSYIAAWSLATSGDAEAWRKLLEFELQREYSLAHDAAAQVQSAARDPLVTTRLSAVSQSVIRPALAAQDDNRRIAALRITVALPPEWVDASWLSEANAVVRNLLRSPLAEQRIVALKALPRVESSWQSIALELLDHDPDEAVQREAFSQLGDPVEHLLTRLRQFLVNGDAGNARAVALRFKEVVYGDRRDAARGLATEQLGSDHQASRTASISALAALYQEFLADDAEWQASIRQVRGIFDERGPEETWRALEPHLASPTSGEREFMRQVVWSGDEAAADRRQLAQLVHQSWPDDSWMAAVCVLLATRCDGARAEQDLRDFEDRFSKSINPVWLGQRYEEISLSEDALRHYQRAVEGHSKEALPYFKVGWARFVEGDIAGSIEMTRRALELNPMWPVAEFNLGLAHLFQRDVQAAEDAYRRGCAIARRHAPSDGMHALDEAIGDLDRFAAPGEDGQAARLRSWLVAERARLAAQV
jgi:tetratricopeptide (TPR) repeat protein